MDTVIDILRVVVSWPGVAMLTVAVLANSARQIRYF